MKNIIIAAGLVVGLFSVSYGGECNGVACVQPRRVVTVTKSVVRETVRFPRRVYNGCANGVCRSRSVTVVR
jgi:hypothetical protein